jgi:hypothetical protein
MNARSTRPAPNCGVWNCSGTETAKLPNNPFVLLQLAAA